MFSPEVENDGPSIAVKHIVPSGLVAKPLLPYLGFADIGRFLELLYHCKRKLTVCCALVVYNAQNVPFACRYGDFIRRERRGASFAKSVEKRSSLTSLPKSELHVAEKRVRRG